MQVEPIDITDTATVWAQCPRCKRSLEFYGKVVCESVGMKHKRNSCLCGEWVLISDIKIAAIIKQPSKAA